MPHQRPGPPCHKTDDQAIGRTIVAIVVMKRHLWLNLLEIRDREKTFHLDALISPSGRFGTSVEMVVGNFR